MAAGWQRNASFYMKKVEFIFDVNDKVKTIFGANGVVESLLFDDAGCQYNVRTKDGDKWLKEKELTAGWELFGTLNPLAELKEAGTE